MDKEAPTLSVNYLTTEQDHINTRMAQLRDEARLSDRVIMQILGIIAICCGVAALIFVGGGFFKNFCWVLLIVIGLFLISFHEVINPAITRSRAKREYASNKDKFVSIGILFYEDRVEIESDRYRGNIPYRYLFKVVEDKNVIILYLDKNDYISIPLRIIANDDREKLKLIKG